MVKLRVTGVQRFSVHDGPGIRTTVFLKGCTLRCPWCCNPENIKGEREVYFNPERCTGCYECVRRCECLERPEDIFRCPDGLRCAMTCPTGAMGVYGEDLEAEGIAEVALRDMDYYMATGGGVTFSGGEPLLQPEGIVSVAEQLGDVHVAVETSLHAPEENLRMLLDQVDLFLVDVKILTPAAGVIGGDPRVFQRNFELLSDSEVTVRFPAVKPYTFNTENIDMLIKFLVKHGLGYLEVLGVHGLGAEKYRSLNLRMGRFSAPGQDEIEDLRRRLHGESIEMKYMEI